MKYHVKCSACDLEKDITADNAPKFCFECGKKLAEVSVVPGKPRLTAEKYMREMDELLPRMTEAYSVFGEFLVEWQRCYQCLQQYWRRGYVSDEEFKRFQGTPYIKKKGK